MLHHYVNIIDRCCIMLKEFIRKKYLYEKNFKKICGQLLVCLPLYSIMVLTSALVGQSVHVMYFFKGRF